MGSLGFFLFGRFFAYYGLAIGLGVLVSGGIAAIQIRRFGLDGNDFLVLVGTCGLFGLAGAKALYLLVSLPEIDFTRILEMEYLASWMRGGFVFLGGVVGMIPALLLCKRVWKIPIRPYLQSCICCVPITHAFGRVGCYLVGCCYGIPYEGPLCVIYTQSQIAPNGIPLFPVQLTEAAAELVIGLCLLAFSRKIKGITGFLCYLISYSIVRFVLEFFRYDSARGSIAGLSTSQWVSLGLFLSAWVLWFWERRKPQANAG